MLFGNHLGEGLHNIALESHEMASDGGLHKEFPARFRFLTTKYDEEFDGSFIERENEMVLEIPWPDDGPYTIVGGREGSFFVAHGEIVARWASVGDAWVGSWKEEGTQYLFRCVSSSG